MRRVSRVDAGVALGFVLAALGEAVARHHGSPGLMVFDAAGALWLGALAVRRSHPVLAIGVLGAAGLLGTTVTALVWPEATDGAGVWIIAMMLASYSLGAHAAGRALGLGVLVPLVVVTGADWTTRDGWERASGMLFVTVFIGLLPTAVGRLVRVRGQRLRALHEQRDLIVRQRVAQQESAVLAERLRTTERLQPVLLEGLQGLATRAEAAGDPGEVEAAARRLLAQTREEVVALTAPVTELPVAEPPEVDHVAALRAAAQPWVVVVAGAVAAGLCLETSRVLELTGPGWLVVPGALLVAAPLALAWWRPVLAVALAWVVVAAWSRLLAPLDGSLSETGFGFAAAFAVAALSRRRTALVGLVVCWLGQLVGVGTDDVVGESVALLVCWLGGLAVGEASRLVEQGRANNELLAREEAASAGRAVVAERLRLAREIHDALGHSLTVVALQAGAARRLAPEDPARAAEVMRTVAAAAREGVASLALDGAGAGGADLAGLVERVRAAGVEVDADLPAGGLPDPGQRAIAFGVVQEALTNVLRHAPGARASVAVRPGERGVEVVVGNSAPTGPGAGPGTGRGLAGIRERVDAGAGRVTWGARPDGGFEVRALLPAVTPAVVAP